MPPPPEPTGTALLLHGAGSTGDFVRRAFAAPLAAAGLRLVAPDARRDGADVDAHVADLDALVATHRPAVVGGVSRGAHVTALWAARAAPAPPVAGLLLALPAWTGRPDDVARLSGLAADDVERLGLLAVLEHVRSTAVGWVGEELLTAWPTYQPDALVASLRAVAASSGPTLEGLRSLRLPAGVVALDADPFHPRRVAEQWVDALPHGALRVLDVTAPAADRGVLGAAAVAALAAAGGPV